MFKKQTFLILSLCASGVARCFDVDLSQVLADSHNIGNSTDSITTTESRPTQIIAASLPDATPASDNTPATEPETFGSDIAVLLADDNSYDNNDFASETDNNFSSVENSTKEYDSFVSDDLENYTPTLFIKAKAQCKAAKSKATAAARKSIIPAIKSAYSTTKENVVFAYNNPKVAFDSTRSSISESFAKRNSNFKDSCLAIVTIAKKAGYKISTACSNGYDRLPSMPSISFSLPSCPKVSLPSFSMPKVGMPTISFKGFTSWFKSKTGATATSNAEGADNNAEATVAPAA